jgi:hypothetical protein
MDNFAMAHFNRMTFTNNVAPEGKATNYSLPLSLSLSLSLGTLRF